MAAMLLSASLAALAVAVFLDLSLTFGIALPLPMGRLHAWEAVSWEQFFFWFAIVLNPVMFGAAWVGHLRGWSWKEATQHAARSSCYLMLPLPVLGLALLVAGGGPQIIASTLVHAVPWVTVISLGAWLGTMWRAGCPCDDLPSVPPERWRLARWHLSIAVLIYVAVFGTLATLQYQALHVPHGDSGMYEEHLWNLLHGKGFRSQLDDGRLFFGEHLQLGHLALLPIFLIWPSLVTLNGCEAVALAIGAYAVLGFARHFGLGPRTAVTLAVLYLLYFPLHYLSLEATWKTFRPEHLGVPLILFGLWKLEQGRVLVGTGLLLAAGLAKEEYFLVAAAVGASMLLQRRWQLGVTLMVTAGALLVFVLEVWIPYFRGDVPHYTPYFAGLGGTPAAIAKRLITDPATIIERLCRPENGTLLLSLLVPLGFTPLLAPSRFVAAMPILGYLMLADADRGLASVQFHFHAPLIPLCWWAAVAGLANLQSMRRMDIHEFVRLLAGLTVAAGLFFGQSPVSWAFWDPAAGMRREELLLPTTPPRTLEVARPTGGYWRDRYFSAQRAAEWPQALAVLKPSDRVAATDLLRSHLTHFAAAHDWPTLRAHVSLDEIDAIVVDIHEGWWGRGSEENADHELLLAMVDRDPNIVGRVLTVRGRPFEVIHRGEWMLVLRQVRSSPLSSISEEGIDERR